MPNWVKNKLTFTGKDSKKILKSLLTQDELDPNRKTFDFNKIIPMPKSLDIESGSITRFCIELYMTSVNPMVDYYGKEKMDIDRFLKIKNLMNSQLYYGEYNFQLSKKEISILLKNLSLISIKDDYEQMAIVKGKEAIDNVEKYGYKDWYDWSIANWGTKWNACDTHIKGNTIEFETAWAPVPKLIQRLSEIYPEIKLEYIFAEEQIGVLTGRLIYESSICSGVPFEDYSKEAYETSFELWGCREEYRFDENTNTYESEDEYVL